mmetsp:Transcript_16228/g.54714  ORF Transcript_16228/g.54714 Transcript_16228/m.54714 type:complete len:254 (-) Transcript_16228:1177-1938(-)
MRCSPTAVMQSDGEDSSVAVVEVDSLASLARAGAKASSKASVVASSWTASSARSMPTRSKGASTDARWSTTSVTNFCDAASAASRCWNTANAGFFEEFAARPAHHSRMKRESSSSWSRRRRSNDPARCKAAKAALAYAQESSALPAASSTTSSARRRRRQTLVRSRAARAAWCVARTRSLASTPPVKTPHRAVARRASSKKASVARRRSDIFWERSGGVGVGGALPSEAASNVINFSKRSSATCIKCCPSSFA